MSAWNQSQQKERAPTTSSSQEHPGKGVIPPNASFLLSPGVGVPHTHTSQRFLPTFAKGRLFLFWFWFWALSQTKQTCQSSLKFRDLSSSGDGNPLGLRQLEGLSFLLLDQARGAQELPSQPSIQETSTNEEGEAAMGSRHFCEGPFIYGDRGGKGDFAIEFSPPTLLPHA